MKAALRQDSSGSKPMKSLWTHLLTGEAAIKPRYSLKDRLWGIVMAIKPRFALMITPVNAASAAVLAYSGYPPLSESIIGFIAVACASAATIILNDIVDHERDTVCWPHRPLPSGRLKPSPALMLAVALVAAALFLTWLYFNLLTFFVLAVVLALGMAYTLYLRRKLGYLTLPPIVGLIYLGGWAAFSPETIFTARLPWFLYLLGVLWQAAHIMIYSPVHPIQRSEAGLQTESKAFFFATSPKGAARLGLAFLILTTLMAILLPVLAGLGALYLTLVIIAAGWALITALKLLKQPTNRATAFRAFSSVSTLRTVISGAILLDVFLLH